MLGQALRNMVAGAIAGGLTVLLMWFVSIPQILGKLNLVSLEYLEFFFHSLFAGTLNFYVFLIGWSLGALGGLIGFVYHVWWSDASIKSVKHGVIGGVVTSFLIALPICFVLIEGRTITGSIV